MSRPDRSPQSFHCSTGLRRGWRGREDDAIARSRLTGIRQAMDEEELAVEVVCSRSPYELDDAALDELLSALSAALREPSGVRSISAVRGRRSGM